MLLSEQHSGIITGKFFPFFVDMLSTLSLSAHRHAHNGCFLTQVSVNVIPDMLTRSTPSTPGGQLSQPPVATPSPGNWRHPKFDEIAARQNAAAFTHSHAKKIVWNLGVLLATYYLRGLTES